MSKNFIVTILVLSLALSALAGCTKNVSNIDPSPAPTASPETSVQQDITDNKQDSLNESPISSATPDATKKPQESTPTPEQTPTSTPTATPTPNPTPTPTPTPAPSISLSSLMSTMIGALPEDTYALSEMPQELYEGVYGINPADYDEVLIYGSMMNVHANEIIIIKAKDKDSVSKAKQALSQRKSALEAQWEHYLPAQYEMVLAGTIKTSGLYATLVIADGGSGAANAFISALK